MFNMPLFVTRTATAVKQNLRHLRQGPGPVLFVVLQLSKIVVVVHLFGWALAWLWYVFAGQYLPGLLRHFQALSPGEQTQMLAHLDASPLPVFWGGLSYTLPLMLFVLILRLPFTLPPRSYQARTATSYNDDYESSH